MPRYSTPRKQRGRTNGYSSTRGRYSGGRGAAATPGGRQPGLFDKGQWYCDCDPRLPALRLQTKKDGPNKHRWFYVCQRERAEQCGFFLFEDGAKAREQAVLLLGGRAQSEVTTSIGPAAPATPTPVRTGPPPPRQNIFHGVPGRVAAGVSSDEEDGDAMDVDTPSRTRSGAASQATGSSSSNTTATNSSSNSSAAEPAPRSNPEPEMPTQRKRKRDDYFSDDEDSDLERQMVLLADESVERAQRQLTIEPKSLSNELLHLKTTITPTKQTSVQHAGGLPTPNTTGPQSRDAKRVRIEPPSPAETPTHSTTTTTTTTTASASNKPLDITTTATADGDDATPATADEDYSITETILRLLPPTTTPASARESVRAELNAYALRVRSVYRARDMARSALSARDARIALLQERVGMLENGRRLDRERMREMRSGLRALADGDGAGGDAAAG